MLLGFLMLLDNSSSDFSPNSLHYHVPSDHSLVTYPSVSIGHRYMYPVAEILIHILFSKKKLYSSVVEDCYVDSLIVFFHELMEKGSFSFRQPINSAKAAGINNQDAWRYALSGIFAFKQPLNCRHHVISE
jgi:hypothetical protein